MCGCGICGSRFRIQPCPSTFPTACCRSKNAVVEGIEQFFYRGTPAVFQTLCEGFFPGLRVFLRGLAACAAVLERCLLADAREG
ncbi:protein of unknown function [Ralstonia solanacearum PSI07]|nr:protein of unknown function [Ralstonia solanacearum PSI07]